MVLELTLSVQTNFSEIKRDLKKFQRSQQQLMINPDPELVHSENSNQTNSNQVHEITVVSNPAYGLEAIEQS